MGHVLIGEGFPVGSVYLQESTKSRTLHVLISGMSRVELHDAVILVLYTETTHGLSAVYVVAPDGNSVDSRDARQEAGKCAFLPVCVYAKFFHLFSSFLYFFHCACSVGMNGDATHCTLPR